MTTGMKRMHDVIDKAIEFYSRSPDGQYDSQVVEWLRELTQLRALRDRLVALKQRGVIPRDDFLAIIARAEELAKE